MKELSEKEILLLRRIYGYLVPSNFVSAVYISPAQQLRKAANEIEQKEQDLSELRELIGL